MDGNYSEITGQLAADLAAFIEANIGAVLSVILIASVIAVLTAVICIVAAWRVFEKAGERGWLCLIPLAGGHVSYKIAWHPFFYWLGLAASCGIEFLSAMQIEGGVNMPYIPLASLLLSLGLLVMWVAYNIKLSMSFGHGVAFAFGLMLLPVIFLPILGFGGSVYEGKIR